MHFAIAATSVDIWIKKSCLEGLQDMFQYCEMIGALIELI
jgi:hypothetical protein